MGFSNTRAHTDVAHTGLNTVAYSCTLALSEEKKNIKHNAYFLQMSNPRENAISSFSMQHDSRILHHKNNSNNKIESSFTIYVYVSELLTCIGGQL